MQSEHRAVRRHGRAAQSLRLSESGVEYLKAYLLRTPAQVQLDGGIVNNTTTMQGLLANSQTDEFSRGRFSIIAPAQIAGLYSGIRFGLENESAKLNLHVLLAEGAEGEAQRRLLALPGMTPDIADAILDWIDADEAPRPFGAEAEHYTGLNPPYAPRNGPIGAIDELLLVRGVTPELLYGLDQNRNMLVDADEVPRGAMLEVDNGDGSMNRGWSAYLTISSVEMMGGSTATPLADLNGGNLQELYNGLKTTLTDEQAKFIILYRQYGAPPQTGGPQGPGGGQPTGNGQPGGGGLTSPSSPQQQTGPQSPGANGGQPGATGETVSATTIELNFQQQGGTRINSMLDLIGATVQVPSTPPGGGNGQINGGGGGGQDGNNNGGDNGGGGGGGNGNNDNGDNNNNGGGGNPGQGGQGGQPEPPPKTVKSPWLDNAASYQDLLKLYDVATVVNVGRVAGRVNVNAAARPVLMSIPFLPPAVVEQIIAKREVEPNITLSNQRHIVWLLTEGVVQLPVMRQIERFVTTRGDAFSGQSVGFFDGDSMPVRGDFILDRSQPPVRLRLWRDLSSWGPGFSPQLLGAVSDTRP